MVGRVDSFSLLLFIALWATQSLTAQQPQITGAFGYKLGEKFDTKAWHAQILTDGALPMAVLDAKNRRWIATQK